MNELADIEETLVSMGEPAKSESTKKTRTLNGSPPDECKTFKIAIEESAGFATMTTDTLRTRTQRFYKNDILALTRGPNDGIALLALAHLK